MTKEYTFNQENKICLSFDNKSIAEGKARVFNKEKYDLLREGEMDITKYICTDVTSCTKTPLLDGEGILYDDLYTAVKYMDKRTEYYRNPLSLAYNLLRGHYYANTDLLDLFKNYDAYVSKEELENRYIKAKELIQGLYSAHLDYETIYTIVNGLYPGFGFFAFEVLSCTNIYYCNVYNLQEYNDLQRDLPYLVPGEIKDLLDNQDIAKTNHQVLSLARYTRNVIK